MEKLSVEESRKLVWLTWFGVFIPWGISTLAIDANKWVVLTLALMLPIMSWIIISFFKKSKNIPKMTYSVVPSLFKPSAFFSLIIALVLICKASGKISSSAIEMGILSILYWILAIPESRY